MKIVKATREDASTIANIVSKSNADVAKKFGIDGSNNPKHPSFYNEEWALADFERGEEYFLYWHEGKCVGCIAYEKSNKDIGYLNRLSVLPEFREQGLGKELVEHIIEYGKHKGNSRISIGIIANHAGLKKWYKKLGFTENGLKEFTHLPFDVLFMKYEIECS